MPRPGALKTLLVLALPMVLARASQSVITFADALQVKHLGSEALVAAATGGLNVLGLAILPMGTVFIVQSFVAQLVGAGQRDAVPRYAWYGVILAALAGALALALIPAIDPLLGLTGYSAATRAQMSDYMQIRMYSIVAIVGTEALGNWFGGLGNTWMQMIAGMLAMVTNVVLNWLLIDGHLGAPAMGVAGAALASTCASFVSFAFLGIAFWRRVGGAPRTAGGTKLSLHELGRVARFGLPNGVNWFFEFAAFQLFINGVLASLGDDTVAALNAVLAVNSLSFMPAFGLASAGAILAGQAIGRGDRDAVWPQVRVTLAVACGWMGLIGALYLVAPRTVLELFEEPGKSGDLVAIGTTMLAISAAWQLFDALGITLSETLRAAGDTMWTATARLVLAWAVFTPAAFLAVRVFDTGAVGAMLCLVAYLGLLAAALAYRFRSGAWRRIELIEPKLVA